jgi:hypothetical protein
LRQLTGLRWDRQSFTSPLPSPPVSPEDLRLPTGRLSQPERVDKDWLPEVSDNRPRAVTPERGRSPAYSPVRNRQPSVGSYEEILRGQREGLYSDVGLPFATMPR